MQNASQYNELQQENTVKGYLQYCRLQISSDTGVPIGYDHRMGCPAFFSFPTGRICVVDVFIAYSPFLHACTVCIICCHSVSSAFEPLPPLRGSWGYRVDWACGFRSATSRRGIFHSGAESRRKNSSYSSLAQLYTVVEDRRSAAKNAHKYGYEWARNKR